MSLNTQVPRGVESGRGWSHPQAWPDLREGSHGRHVFRPPAGHRPALRFSAAVHSNPRPLRFSTLGPKAIDADFHGGRLTTDSGALLLREAADRIGLFDALDAAIPDPRHPVFIIHDQEAMLAQRVVALALGYVDLNDHQALRDDPALQRAAGTMPDPDLPLASPPTFCRLEDRVGRAALVRIAGVLVDQSLAAHDAPPEPLILDFDATDDPVHGRQEERSFHGYDDPHGFLPLYVVCGDESLVASLRPSDIDAAKHAGAVLALLVGRLRAAWPEVKITIRADSGFCRWRTMRRCDSQGVGDVLGLAKDSALQRAARDEIERAQRQFRRTGRPRRVFGSSSYAAGSRDRPRRVIVKAEHGARGASPRFVVANVPGDPRELSEDVDCQRGEAEDRIKERRLDPFAGRTSCHRFVANQFRLLWSSAAYVLVQALRRTALVGTERARAQVGTIRLRLLKVAARVVVSARRVVFHLASGYPYRAVSRAAFARVMIRPPLPAAGSG